MSFSKQVSAGFLLLVVLINAVTVTVSDKSIPVYKIDLNKPPEERWTQIAKDFKADAKNLLIISKKFLPAPLLKLAWFIADKLENLPEEIAGEIQGMSTASGMPVGELISLAIFYDISSFSHTKGYKRACTGIVAQNSSGMLFHGRNFDYNFGDLLKQMTITVDFQRSNKTVFTVTTFAYLSAIFTGQKPGQFSLSIDERDSGTYVDNLVMAIYTKFRHPVGIVAREVLEYAKSYEEALGMLQTVHLVAPVYFIIAGTRPSEGAVVTRDRLKPADVWTMNNTENGWYLLETNYDHWKQTPSHDKRRETARKGLEALGRDNVRPDTIFSVLSKFPVKNSHTIFTMVMSPTDPGLYYSTAKIRT